MFGIFHRVRNIFPSRGEGETFSITLYSPSRNARVSFAALAWLEGNERRSSLSATLFECGRQYLAPAFANVGLPSPVNWITARNFYPRPSRGPSRYRAKRSAVSRARELILIPVSARCRDAIFKSERRRASVEFNPAATRYVHTRDFCRIESNIFEKFLLLHLFWFVSIDRKKKSSPWCELKLSGSSSTLDVL